MASGLPVVTTRIGGNPGLIEDGHSGLLVPAGDAPALAAAMVRLLSSPELSAKVATAARERAVAEFGMNRMIEHMETLYRRTLDLEDSAPAVASGRSR
jgi:glycosyltransferase involved in cell wall biosynthesis